jgi:hypothetical protein
MVYPKDQFGHTHDTTFTKKSAESYAVMETDEDVKMATQVDEINAYSFIYPVGVPGNNFSFKWYVGYLQYNLAPYILLLRLILLSVSFLATPGELG